MVYEISRSVTLKKIVHKFFCTSRERSRSHATIYILFLLRGISLRLKVETTFSSLIFWKNSAVYDFVGAIDISNQTKGRVSRHPARDM